ncbi:MAG TPA: hypothetical protein VHD87_15065 [Acidimicrobiales bacterium]|nr:hypothetical protein [Acidimicrobiales bacterium]
MDPPSHVDELAAANAEVVTGAEIVAVRESLFQITMVGDEIWPLHRLYDLVAADTGLPPLTITEAFRALDARDGFTPGPGRDQVTVNHTELLFTVDEAPTIPLPVPGETAPADEDVRIAAARLCQPAGAWVDLEDVIELLLSPIDQGRRFDYDIAHDVLDELEVLGVIHTRDFDVSVNRAKACHLAFYGLDDRQRARLAHGPCTPSGEPPSAAVVRAAAEALNRVVLSLDYKLETHEAAQLVDVTSHPDDPAGVVQALVALGGLSEYRGTCRLRRQRLDEIAGVVATRPRVPHTFIEACAGRLAALPTAKALEAGERGHCVLRALFGFGSHGFSSCDPFDYLLDLFHVDGLISDPRSSAPIVVNHRRCAAFAGAGRAASEAAAEYDFVEYVLSRRSDFDRPTGTNKKMPPRCICAFDPDACARVHAGIPLEHTLRRPTLRTHR